jgi:hypothetical protein
MEGRSRNKWCWEVKKKTRNVHLWVPVLHDADVEANISVDVDPRVIHTSTEAVLIDGGIDRKNLAVLDILRTLRSFLVPRFGVNSILPPTDSHNMAIAFNISMHDPEFCDGWIQA